VKHLLAYPAIAAAAAATATAFQDNAELAAWFALAATILTGAQSFQDPGGKETDHQRRNAEAELIARQARYLRTLTPAEERSKKELDALAVRLRDLQAAPYSPPERQRG
jgi:hypothetical protein